MLLTDGNPNQTIDLTAYESSILGVANVEMIDLSVKLGLATEEISEEALDILLDHARAFDPLSTVRRRIGVSDVVVTPQMKRWHALHTLAIVYRDAFNNQLNDRYQAKFEEYRTLSRNAREHTVHFGIGLALNPVPQAQTPGLAIVPGNAAGGTFYVAVAWVSALGQVGAPSLATATSTAAMQNVTVTAVNPPSAANLTLAGFNVYMGTTETALTLQNSSPMGIGQTFTMPDSGLVAGAAAGTGQAADVFVTGGSMLRRG